MEVKSRREEQTTLEMMEAPLVVQSNKLQEDAHSDPFVFPFPVSPLARRCFVGLATATMLMVIATLFLSFFAVGVMYTLVYLIVNGLVMTWLEWLMQEDEDQGAVAASQLGKLSIFCVTGLWLLCTLALFAVSILKLFHFLPLGR